MQTQIPADQAKQNQFRTQSQGQSQNQSPLTAQAQFEDGRPELADQLQQQTHMSASPQVSQLQRMQAMMASGPQVRQRQSMQTMMAASAQAKHAQSPVQRMEEDEPLQAKTDQLIQREQSESPADAAPPKPNNTGLPDNLKTGIENLSGISMDHVKVHYNSDKPAQLQAHAYAQGNEIHVAPGQEKHLPHEAWHVVQQAQGRVRPTVQMKGGVGVNDDVGLEKEADVMGERAVGQNTLQLNKQKDSVMQSVFPVAQHAHVMQAMFVPYTRKDTGYDDDTAVFADEHIGTVVFDRFDHMKYTKADGTNTGSVKHYVPYHWIMKNLADKWVIGYRRRDVHGNLKGILNVLGIPVPTGLNPTTSVLAFNTWVAEAVYSVCDWEENLFKDQPSSGDGGGATLDTPSDPAVLVRVQAAFALLASCSLASKPI